MFQIQKREKEIDVRKAQILSLKNYQHFHLSAESHSDQTEAIVDTTEAKYILCILYILYIYREREYNWHCNFVMNINRRAENSKAVGSGSQ